VSGADYMVTVCAACRCASCWHGEFYCEASRSAGLVAARASELRSERREHTDHFSRQKLFDVTGTVDDICPSCGAHGDGAHDNLGDGEQLYCFGCGHAWIPGEALS
jgi:hypothetical protein